ncbi:MAG: c-type cytochrome [Verrucomicrobia bacterium]|nr:c-type cytochrome [Verrucomicrobiota bacterium]
MRVLAQLAFLVALAGAGRAADLGEEWSGGETTVFDTTRNAFSLPAHNLAGERRAAFFVGNSFFNQNWITAPGSPAARDGLGPLFNTRSCSACHFKDGRSRPPEPGQPMAVMLLRISVPGAGAHGGARPDPVYGDQIQGDAILGVPREADVLVDYTEKPGTFADGEKYSLRHPRYRLENLGYGPVAKNLLTSPRTAPAMIGMGLLEAVPEAALRALADPEDNNRDGISGKINRVWSMAKKGMAVGRFGWKAEQPTVLEQTAGAFAGDIGITSSLAPEENHTARQEVCVKQPNGGAPEASDRILHDVAFYGRTLGVPARRHWSDPRVRRGQVLFTELQCAACHVPELKTGDWPEFPELARQTIRPYTDLLLHDLGEELADDRPVFQAGGREWRTTPLWGIGLVERVNGHTFFLHDGRARNLTEAILWHGGEAEASREKFRALSRADRAAVIAFLESL